MKRKTLKYVLILAVMLMSSIVNAQWVQIGSDIDGEAYADYSGTCVSLSSDGSVVAIGADGNDDGGTYAGHVRIYENIAGIWTQIGQDIDGEAAGDFSGASVSLSSDGSVIAIGAYGNDGNDTNAGHVRIYENIAGTWTQTGNDIDGEAADDHSGISVSLSADGSVVAIGAPYNDEKGNYAGHVRIYRNISGIWTQIGSDIDGEAATNFCGASVSLSSDGSVLAIGAYGNDGNNGDSIFTGHVRVFKNISGTWIQIGNNIDGEAADDHSGISVSLSADGSIVAIGASYNDGHNGDSTSTGHVRIYENIAGTWTQIGSDIDGEAAYDYSGLVTLSSDGTIVAIGAAMNDGIGNNAGHVRIYQNISGTWTQKGIDIDGEVVGDYFGCFVSLSADGLVVAIGALFNGVNYGAYAGHVRVYTYQSVGVKEISNTVEVGVYPNPTKGKITVECEGMERVEVFDVAGRVVYEIASSLSPRNDVVEIDISGFSKGVYFVKVSSDDGVGVEGVVLE